MKLFYIVNARIPTEKAHGYQIVKMCEEFAKTGCDVELVAPSRSNDIKQDLFQYYGIKRIFKFKIIKSADFLKYDRIIGKAGLYLQWLFFTLKMLFIKIDKDTLIYTRDQGAVWAFSLRGYKVCYECHGWFEKKTGLILPLLKRANWMIITNNFIKNQFVKHKFDANKILVAPNGVDLEKFDIKENQEECRKKLNLPLDKKIVLYTGHLYEWKGVTTLAASSVSLDEDTFIIFVGGTKEDIERFKSEILNLKSKIWVVGHRPHSEIPYWLKAADVLVLPNSAKEEISKFWTSPIKMFEYMASQRPIISSDLPSIREILNGQNCIFCQPGDAEDLAKKIKQVLNNPTLGEKLAGQAYQDVLQYSWDKRARKILEFISG